MCSPVSPNSTDLPEPPTTSTTSRSSNLVDPEAVNMQRSSYTGPKMQGKSVVWPDNIEASRQPVFTPTTNNDNSPWSGKDRRKSSVVIRPSFRRPSSLPDLSQLSRPSVSGGSRRPTETLNHAIEHAKDKIIASEYETTKIRIPESLEPILEVLLPDEPSDAVDLATDPGAWARDIDVKLVAPDRTQFIIKREATREKRQILAIVAELLHCNAKLPMVAAVINQSKPETIKHLAENLRKDTAGKFLLNLSMKLLTVFGDGDDEARDAYIALQLQLMATDVTLRGFVSTFFYLSASMLFLTLSGLVSMGKWILSLFGMGFDALLWASKQARSIVLAGWRHLFAVIMLGLTFWFLFAGTSDQIEEHKRYGYIATAEPQCGIESAWTAIPARALSLVFTALLLTTRSFFFGLERLMLLPRPWSILTLFGFAVTCFSTAAPYVVRSISRMQHAVKCIRNLWRVYPKTSIPATILLLLSIADLTSRHQDCFSIIAWFVQKASMIPPTIRVLIILSVFAARVAYKFTTDDRWQHELRTFCFLVILVANEIWGFLPSRKEVVEMLVNTVSIFISVLMLIIIDRLFDLGVTDAIWNFYRSLPVPIQVATAMIFVAAFVYWLACRVISFEIIQARFALLYQNLKTIFPTLWNDHPKSSLTGVLLVLTLIDMLVMPFFFSSWPSYGYTGQLASFLQAWSEENSTAASIIVCVASLGLICYYLRAQIGSVRQKSWSWFASKSQAVCTFVRSKIEQFFAWIVGNFFGFLNVVKIGQEYIDAIKERFEVPDGLLMAFLTAFLSAVFTAILFWLLGWTAVGRFDIGVIYANDGTPSPNLRVYQ